MKWKNAETDKSGKFSNIIYLAYSVLQNSSDADRLQVSMMQCFLVMNSWTESVLVYDHRIIELYIDHSAGNAS